MLFCGRFWYGLVNTPWVLKKKKKGKRKGKLLARVLTSYDCTQNKNRVAGGMSTYPKKKGQHERRDERNNDEERTKYL